MVSCNLTNWTCTISLLHVLHCMGFCIATNSPVWSHTGRLHPPQNVTRNSSIIEWKPPYSAMNNESDIIHVDPHITQYTVYITDNYTGNIIVTENVTETQFTPINQGNILCPMYRVSAWNVGGEGELSEPVQESTPQGKHPAFTVAMCTQAKNFLIGLLALHHISFLLAVSLFQFLVMF